MNIVWFMLHSSASRCSKTTLKIEEISGEFVNDVKFFLLNIENNVGWHPEFNIKKQIEASITDT